VPISMNCPVMPIPPNQSLIDTDRITRESNHATAFHGSKTKRLQRLGKIRVCRSLEGEGLLPGVSAALNCLANAQHQRKEYGRKGTRLERNGKPSEPHWEAQPSRLPPLLRVPAPMGKLHSAVSITSNVIPGLVPGNHRAAISLQKWRLPSRRECQKDARLFHIHARQPAP
jgi:hypothetical protein